MSKAAASTHPKYIEMICAAIAALKDRTGSSRQAIVKYIKANYSVGDNADTQVKLALKRGCEQSALVHAKGIGASGSFKLPKKAVKAKPAVKKVVKKPAVKKAAAKKKVVAKSPAKKAKSPAKKPAAKKAAAKKPAAKKPAAKKPAAKVAKKSPKKATAKPKKAAAKPKKATKSPKKK